MDINEKRFDQYTQQSKKCLSDVAHATALCTFIIRPSFYATFHHSSCDYGSGKSRWIMATARTIMFKLPESNPVDETEQSVPSQPNIVWNRARTVFQDTPIRDIDPLSFVGDDYQIMINSNVHK